MGSMSGHLVNKYIAVAARATSREDDLMLNPSAKTQPTPLGRFRGSYK